MGPAEWSKAQSQKNEEVHFPAPVNLNHHDSGTLISKGNVHFTSSEKREGCRWPHARDRTATCQPVCKSVREFVCA
ncbi:hypothetical protein AMECASPLE_012909 [Ameca splendens]|uniref:Uncharacterized protein n=1 Tax=Ameca splendens TaxID=208324 RepID=A0ABV0ZMS0_9TELE